MSDLSSSSIESHMYAVFFVSPSSGGRRELEKQLSSKVRGTNRTKMTQGSLFLESVVKKVLYKCHRFSVVFPMSVPV